MYNIYQGNTCAIMKKMYPPGFHHNDFVATHALGYMMHVMYTENVVFIEEPAGIDIMAYISCIYLYMCMFVYTQTYYAYVCICV